MTSHWRATSPGIPTDPFDAERSSDDLVVGAGITGLVTALLLARAGRRVTVIDAREVGAVTTGHTTAKLSLLQGTHLSAVRSRNLPKVFEAYVAANRAAQDWVLDYAAQTNVAVERRDAVTFAFDERGRNRLDREFAAAERAGLPVRRQRRLDVPFGHAGGIVVPDQAQFHPLELLAALAAEFRSLGGAIVENTRLLTARASDPVIARTTRGDLLADRLYLATGTPVLDRGLYFAKLEPMRSYAQTFRVPGAIPQDMYLSADQPTRSLRTTPDGAGGQLLLVGGEGHGVGRARATEERYEEIAAWTRAHFPGAQETARWSAQDYRTPHRVPFVGWLPRGRGRIFLATGFDKWGMTNGVAAALTLVGDSLGETPDWARTLHHRITTPAALASGVSINAKVAVWMARGWASALTAPRERPVAEGEGALTRQGIRPVGVSRVDGRVCAVSAICPHTHGVLAWNDGERTWDCPLHGSRFSADGRLLEGPAVEDLPRADGGEPGPAPADETAAEVPPSR